MARLPSTLLASLLLLYGAPVAAQVRECIHADGTLVYTDKACSALGAEKAPERTQPRLLSRYRNACARDLQELMLQLSTAIEVGDVNQLAAYYQWNGLSTRAGYDIMDRLETIASRPLLDILPVYPQGLEASPDNPLYYPPILPHDPVGLRIEQTLDDGTTPAPTTLRLAQQVGCWWVRL